MKFYYSKQEYYPVFVISENWEYCDGTIELTNEEYNNIKNSITEFETAQKLIRERIKIERELRK